MMAAHKTAYTWAGLILLWLVLVASAFWFLEYRYWQSFNQSTVIFEGSQLDRLWQRLHKQGASVGENERGITIVHFTEDSCPCVSYSQQHIKQLQPILKQTQQYILQSDDARLVGVSLPATPSVAIWDEQGRLAYFGPYSSGLHCGQGEDFVTTIMNKLDQQINPMWINMVGHGCYCPWQSEA